MTSQAILGDNPMVVSKLESNVSKGDGIRRQKSKYAKARWCNR